MGLGPSKPWHSLASRHPKRWLEPRIWGERRGAVDLGAIQIKMGANASTPLMQTDEAAKQQPTDEPPSYQLSLEDEFSLLRSAEQLSGAPGATPSRGYRRGSMHRTHPQSRSPSPEINNKTADASTDAQQQLSKLGCSPRNELRGVPAAQMH